MSENWLELDQEIKEELKNRLQYTNETFFNDRDYFLSENKVIDGVHGCQCFANCSSRGGGNLTKMFIDYICKKEGLEDTTKKTITIIKKWGYKKEENELIETIEHPIKTNLRQFHMINDIEYRYNEIEYGERWHTISKLNKEEWSECFELQKIIRKHILKYIQENLIKEKDRIEFPVCKLCLNILSIESKFCNQCGTEVKI